MRNAIRLFFLLLVSIDGNSQLKEFEITPLPKPEISIVQANTEFEEDALIIIYSSLSNLNFRSSMGYIDKQSYNQQSNRYEILVRPVKQILLVFSSGFMEGNVSTINPKSKDVFYFKVEEKKNIPINQTIPGKLTINSIPTGANISLNGIPVATKTPFTGELNPGRTRIQLIKAKHQTLDTILNIQSSINEVLTINLKPSNLWLNITSNPPGAQVEIDGIAIGVTPFSKELDLIDKSKQGPRSLKLTLPGYSEQIQTILVYPSKDPLKVNVELKKLEGKFLIESTPSGAEVFIDGVYNGQTPLVGSLPLGIYSVELKMEDYLPSEKKQIVVSFQTTVNLKENLVLKKQPINNLGNEFEDQFEDEFVKDASGNSYKTVKIGDQVWMAENLITNKYSNGDLINNIKDNYQWSNSKIGAWCNYDNLIINDKTYGKLYNWYAVNDSRNVCPIGWHVPTVEDWTILSDNLGGDEFAGGKLKEIDYLWWKFPNIGATNERGFTAIASGCRFNNGSFGNFGRFANWWTTNELDSKDSWNIYLSHANSSVSKYTYNKNSGFSVRCIMD